MEERLYVHKMSTQALLKKISWKKYNLKARESIETTIKWILLVPRVTIKTEILKATILAQ